ncbi:MAG: DUF992 domain-containing protein [Gammaproteobacteria bacterium]|nr:DUF992 domain-containing protein [Gammaproteobacteria bacterium]
MPLNRFPLKRSRTAALLGACALGLGLHAASVSAMPNQAGVLMCKSVPGSRINLIIRSTTDIKCTFEDSTGKVVKFKGETGIALGADLTFGKQIEEFGFTVFSANTNESDAHAIAGKYIGGKASASLGIGAGAAVMLGGDNDNFSLQPLALEANTGFGAAAGLGFLYIEPDVD